MRADKVETRKVEWVWHPYIPNHMVTMMTGDPAAGKGWVTTTIGAAISRGQGLPGQSPGTPARVLYLCAEDNPEHVLVPRLKLQGADLGNVRLWPHVFDITKTGGLEELRNLVLDEKPAVVFIDPVTSFMGDSDPNKPTIVNQLLSRLAELAREQKIAIVAVRHRRKPADGDRKGRDPKFGGLGSIGFQGGARSELLVGMTADGQRAMSHEKTNVGPEGETLAFNLDPDDGHLTWEGTRDDISGWDLVGKMKKRGPGRPAGGEKQEEARAFLRTYLQGGPRTPTEVIDAGQKAGLTKATICLVKKDVVRAYRQSDKWWWELAPGAKDA